MKLYSLLSGIRALRSYSSKFMFIAFLGIHIPLLGIVAVLFITSGSDIKKTSFFLLTLGLTLLATAITLTVLHWLTAPLRHTQKQLSTYLLSSNSPTLPVNFTDETGLLMRDIDALVKRQQDIKLGIKAQSANILAAINSLNNENLPGSLAVHTKSIELAVNKQLQLLNDAGSLGQR